jgi:hypothetical protein
MSSGIASPRRDVLFRPDRRASILAVAGVLAGIAASAFVASACMTDPSTGNYRVIPDPSMGPAHLRRPQPRGNEPRPSPSPVEDRSNTGAGGGGEGGGGEGGH